jgi:hypothetical protein
MASIIDWVTVKNPSETRTGIDLCLFIMPLILFYILDRRIIGQLLMIISYFFTTVFFVFMIYKSRNSELIQYYIAPGMVISFIVSIFLIFLLFSLGWFISNHEKLSKNLLAGIVEKLIKYLLYIFDSLFIPGVALLMLFSNNTMGEKIIHVLSVLLLGFLLYSRFHKK